MEDERVISLTARSIKETAMYLFKVLFAGTEKAYELYNDRNLGNRVFNGETEWNKFMNSLDAVTIKELENNEINLDKFKQELEKYGIGFSFYKHPDGKTVSIAFLVKHKDIVEKALSDTLEKIVKEDNFTEKVKKNPKEQTLSEKLNFYKEKEAQHMNKDKVVDNIKDIDIHKGEKRL